MPPRPSVPSDPGERVRIKRAYRAVRVSDGKRILIDRLWPRGVSKDRVRLHGWMKEIAPSDDLREWFHDHPDAWGEFRSRYEVELTEKGDLIRELVGYAKDGVVTLVYASKDEEHNNAVVLRDHLRRQFAQEEN